MFRRHQSLTAGAILPRSLCHSLLLALCLAPVAVPIAEATPLRTTAEPAASSPPPGTDGHGDPLPPGARARLGAARFRHGDVVRCVVFSPDGKILAASGLNATGSGWGAAQLWQVETGEEIQILDSDPLSEGLAFSPDGKVLATGGEHGAVYRWDVQTGRGLSPFKGEQDDITVVAFSPDGKILASGSENATISLWEADTGKLLRTCREAGGLVESLAFTPDGKLLVSAGQGFPRLWDVPSGKETRQFGEGGDAAAVSPDGRTVAVAHPRGIVFWDLATGEEERTVQVLHEQLMWIAYAPDGRTLATGSGDGIVRLWDAARGRELHPPEGHQAWVMSVAYSPDCQTVATAGDDGTVHLWEAATGKELRRLGCAESGSTSLAFAPDGSTLAAGDEQGDVSLYTPATGKLLHEFKGHDGGILALVFSPDGRTLAASTVEDLQLWDLATAKRLLRFTERESFLGCAAFAPDGTKLASVGWKETVRLWEATSGKELSTFTEPGGWTFFAAFTPDRKSLVCGVASDPDRREFTIRLWDLAAGKDVRRFRIEPYPDGVFALSPDGKILAMSRREALVLVEMATGKERRRLIGHRSPITSIAFAPDGGSLTSVSKDTTGLVWEGIGLAPGDSARPLAPGEADGLWSELADEDAVKADAAVRKLAAAPAQTLPFVREHLRRVRLPKPDPKQLAALIADLDNDDYAVRSRASTELEKLGEAAEPALRQVLRGQPSPEVRPRVEDLMEKLADAKIRDDLLASRVTEVLERTRGSKARQLLESLAGGAPEARLTQEAKASLERLGKRPAPVP